jgi:hypothetical protein
VTKRKISLTVEAEVLDMAQRAADAEQKSLSDFAERALRLLATEYVPQTIEIDKLDNGAGSVRVSRNGQLLYARRGTARGTSVGISGTIIIEVEGAIRLGALEVGLRRLAAEKRPANLRQFSLGGTAKIRLANLTPKQAGLIDQLLIFGAEMLAAVEVTSAADIISRKCHTCPEFMESLSVWAPPNGTEVREWRCAGGHRITISIRPPGT